ncbi:thymidylate synthase [Vibrio nigripulchritudo ATCC 27043]|uniref:thymidylate synthase n=1 Tax=Vibrio nigripulchritudo TaxID=28173 RepID=UPI00021C1EF5|nr:thymidylate synthase [Vibrio nigripulchritudo]EGU61061.1 thymidylate synthase [Vibrio nigripulchritudo ATCC 27043]
MHSETYFSIDELLVKTSKILLEEAKPRETRGFTCYELTEPIIIKLLEPTSRIVNISERKWPLHIGYAESLWIANGRNDLDFMSEYLPKLSDFSDDKKYIRAGYGPRLRRYNSLETDYEFNSNFNEQNEIGTDQLRYVIECLSSEKFSRRAVIEFGDPIKDNFKNNLVKETKDFPCTRTIHFMINSNNELDAHVHMRSNDFIWGMTGVNIFNFTFMQEYISKIINVKMGSYYHVANNLHYYDYHYYLLKKLSKSSFVCDKYEYVNDIKSYDVFSEKLKQLSDWEKSLRLGQCDSVVDLESDFINDWQKVLYQHLTGNKQEFVNRLLNKKV